MTLDDPRDARCLFERIYVLSVVAEQSAILFEVANKPMAGGWCKLSRIDFLTHMRTTYTANTDTSFTRKEMHRTVFVKVFLLELSIQIVCGTSCSDISVCSISNGQINQFPILSNAQKALVDKCVCKIIEICNCGLNKKINSLASIG